jgi:hypothetical protein
LQVVTPAGSRLTMAAGSVLHPPYGQWVVGGDSGFHDARTGIGLRFNGSGFVPAEEGQTAFDITPDDADGTQLQISFRVRHAPAATTLLGGAAQLLYEALTGGPPSGWGTSEPITSPWKREELTRFCRDRAPTGTLLCHIGHSGPPAQGTLRVERTAEGIDEHTRLHVGHQPGESFPVDLLAQAIDDLAAEHHLLELTAVAQPGRPDLSAIPNRTDPPTPVGIALGPDAIADLGPEHAFAAPGTAVRIGNRRRPSAWYPARRNWAELEQLLQHLHPDQTGGSQEAGPHDAG